MKQNRTPDSERSAGAVPAVIAHRGAAHDAPENTLAAFNRAGWLKQLIRGHTKNK